MGSVLKGTRGKPHCCSLVSREKNMKTITKNNTGTEPGKLNKPPRRVSHPLDRWTEGERETPKILSFHSKTHAEKNALCLFSKWRAGHPGHPTHPPRRRTAANGQSPALTSRSRSCRTPCRPDRHETRLNTPHRTRGVRVPTFPTDRSGRHSAPPQRCPQSRTSVLQWSR